MQSSSIYQAAAWQSERIPLSNFKNTWMGEPALGPLYVHVCHITGIIKPSANKGVICLPNQFCMCI